MRRAFAALLGLALVGGCSNIDQFDLPKNASTGGPTPKSIVTRLKCELAVLAADNYRFKDFIDSNHFVVGVQLDLTVTDDGTLAPSFTYTNGIFSFNVGAKYDISRAQNFTERLFLSIDDIRAQTGGRAPNDPNFPGPLDCPRVDTLLAGDLGIVRSVEMALFTPDLALISTKLSGTAGAFGGSVNFMVTKNLNSVGPTYTLTHFKGPGSLAGISELNNDKLTFAFAARSATGNSPPTAKADSFLNTLIQGQIANQIGSLKSPM
jgi:hypothetical protein